MLHLCPPKNRMAAWDFEVGSVLVGFKPFSIIHQKWWQLSLHSSLFQGVWTHWTAQKNVDRVWAHSGGANMNRLLLLIGLTWLQWYCWCIMETPNIAIRYSFPMQTDQPTQPIFSDSTSGWLDSQMTWWRRKKPKSYMTGGPWLLRGERVCSRMVKRLGARKQSSKH